VLFRSGGRYNPGTNSWTATSITNAPAARFYHTAVWTGSEMIVWGGYDENFNFLNTGGRYNPSTDSWTAISTANTPAVRAVHSAVWTGSEMIVWGGIGSDYLNTGGRYNPSTDSWTATSTTNAPSSRALPTAVWTGSEMIVWGGDDNGVPFNTGGRYNPDTDSWTATTTTNAPTPRYSQSGVWTGTEMIIWGGYDGRRETNTGGKYCAQASPPITLSATIRKVEGINTVHLSWSGASSRQIDVYRCVRKDESGYDCNRVPIVTTANDGSYSDSTGDTGRASYKYLVCEAGTSTCSNAAEVPHPNE